MGKHANRLLPGDARLCCRQTRNHRFCKFCRFCDINAPNEHRFLKRQEDFRR